QMKMFLTRLGNNSKAIITGDVTQIDLPFLRKSGLVDALEILDGINGICIFKFTHKDVVRHPLVQKIILAYEKRDRDVMASADKRQRETFKRRPKA
ncbi:MAG: PhoH family protein, partial [Clostridia bacterium]|nr:PhoH family protein [Clostridia bacterium]